MLNISYKRVCLNLPPTNCAIQNETGNTYNFRESIEISAGVLKQIYHFQIVLYSQSMKNKKKKYFFSAFVLLVIANWQISLSIFKFF